MAKAVSKKSAVDTRQRAIDDAKAKIVEAEAAGVAAKAEFDAAETDDARAAAQAKINAATEVFNRYEAALEALVKPAATALDDDEEPTMRDFIVGSAIRHNGVDYAEGETISLDKKSFDQIASLGVLSGRA